MGRKEETEQLIRILAKSTKKNAILVGPPGVGKTAIVEKFVWSIVTGNCHPKFRKAKVLALDVTSIIAGTMYRGTAEARFQKLIQFLQENLVVFCSLMKFTPFWVLVHAKKGVGFSQFDEANSGKR